MSSRSTGRYFINVPLLREKNLGVSRTALVRPFWTGLIGLVWNHQNLTLRNENRSPGPIIYCSRTGILDPFRTACFESFLNGQGQYSLEQFGLPLNPFKTLPFFAILERP